MKRQYVPTSILFILVLALSVLTGYESDFAFQLSVSSEVCLGGAARFDYFDD